MQNFYSRSWGIGKDVQNGGIESEGVHRYVERRDSPVAKKGIFSRFNEKSTKFVVLSYSAYLLDHCFFCIFQLFLRPGLF